jgi:hypothetical protein
LECGDSSPFLNDDLVLFSFKCHGDVVAGLALVGDTLLTAGKNTQARAAVIG